MGAGARRILVLALASLPFASCARSSRLDARLGPIATAVAEAEAMGAMGCAPRELAIAQSHLEFARLERAQGDLARALAHVERADENVRAARVLVAQGRCATPIGAAAPPSPGAPAAPAQ